MDFLVHTKSVYGNDLIYPACDTSRKFAELLNTKTLTPRAMRIVKELGYNVRVAIAIDKYHLIADKHGVTNWHGVNVADVPFRRMNDDDTSGTP